MPGNTEKLFDSAHGEGSVELGIALKVVSAGGRADLFSPAAEGDMLRKVIIFDFFFGLAIPSMRKFGGKIPQIVKQSEQPVPTPHNLTNTVVGKRTQVGEVLTFVP